MSNYGALEKFLRVGEGRRLKQLAKQADYVTSLEPDFEALSDEELVGKTAEFKERLENGEELDVSAKRWLANACPPIREATP